MSCFFIFANAGGVGGDDDRRKNIVVDRVSLNGQVVPFTLKNAVLRVKLPHLRVLSSPSRLTITVWCRVVRQAAAV
jgi:hypothetical protein